MNRRHLMKLLSLLGLGSQAAAAPATATAATDPWKLTSAEWKKRLTPGQYAVLRGEDGKLLQGRELIARARRCIGESSGKLVRPNSTLGKYTRGCRIHKGLELSRGTTHVSWGTEDDRINCFQVVPVGFDILYGNQQAACPGLLLHATSDSFCNTRGMAEATVINHGYFNIHDGSRFEEAGSV